MKTHTHFQEKHAVNLDGFVDASALADFLVSLPSRGIPRAFRRYAIFKAAAMRARVNGRISEAMDWERACDVEMTSIPSAWKW